VNGVTVALSCQKHKSKHLDFKYIYPISYKNAKRQTPEKGSALIEKRYHNFWTGFYDCKYIAEIKGVDNKQAEP